MKQEIIDKAAARALRRIIVDRRVEIGLSHFVYTASLYLPRVYQMTAAHRLSDEQLGASPDSDVLEADALYRNFDAILNSLAQHSSDLSYLRESFWRRVKFAFTGRI